MNIPIADQNIISLLGIEFLSDEKKVAIIEKVTTLVEKRLLVRIFDSLDAMRQAELTELLDKEDPQAIQTFLDQQVPNMGEMAEQEIAQVKTELADWVENLA